MADEIVNLDVPEFPLQAESVKTVARDINFILDLPLELRVELGRGTILVQDLMLYTAGSVITLGKLAGEPLEVVVNDRLIGRGEVVIINDKFGIRITDIVGTNERIGMIR